jgi:cell wall-associated NlpC family hydrolase
MSKFREGTEGGFDCSGLTHAAYAAAGVAIPRTADTQWRAGPVVGAGQPLAPGDLLFYGTAGRATHVALYLGGGRVVHAPDVGQLVQVADADMPGYLGATRPSPPAAARPETP